MSRFFLFLCFMFGVLCRIWYRKSNQCFQVRLHFGKDEADSKKHQEKRVPAVLAKVSQFLGSESPNIFPGGSKAGREGRCLVGGRLSHLGGPLPVPLSHLLGSCHTRPAQAVAKVPRVGRSRSRDSAFERVDCCQAQNSYVIKFQLFNSGINYFNRNALFKSKRSSPNSPPAKMVFFVHVLEKQFITTTK